MDFPTVLIKMMKIIVTGMVKDVPMGLKNVECQKSVFPKLQCAMDLMTVQMGKTNQHVSLLL